MRVERELPQQVVRVIDQYFATPVKLGKTGTPHDIRASSLQKIEALALASLVVSVAPADSLEIGFAEGGSCAAITAARKSRGLAQKHIVLDPYQETHSDRSGLLEMERLGLADGFKWIPERSENYLNAAVSNGRQFDFIFDDGGHDIGQAVTDAFYIAKALRPGGIAVFHDGLLFSTATAVRHLINECGFSIVRLAGDNWSVRLARRIRYSRRLGFWYARCIIPFMCRSLVALRAKG